jgi:hypothetical protein
MTIKQYLELEKIKENFSNSANEYLKKHDQQIKDIKIVQHAFLSIDDQLRKLTKYFYEQ